MTGPYWMVGISIISASLLSLLLFIYKFVWPKKNINYLTLVILISILPIISIFRPGTYESGDLTLHSLRAILYYDILIGEGTFPRWTPTFNSNFGDPHFLFSYVFHYFFASILHLVGFSFITSVKLLLASSFIASGIGMFYWVKSEINEKAAFVSSIFYLFAPYHLVDMHFRVTVGETLSWPFLPFCMFFTKMIFSSKKYIWTFLLSISFALLILTHQVISLSLLPILILYALFLLIRNKKNSISKRGLIRFIIAIFSSILLTFFYWFPIVTESKFTQAETFNVPIAFPGFLEIIYSPWRYGLLFQGPRGELSYILGYTHWIVVIFVAVLFFKKKIIEKNLPITIFFLSLFTITIFFILPISKSVWGDTIPLLNLFQFSTRFLIIASLFASFLAAILTAQTKKTWLIILLCLLTIGSTILNWGNRRSIPHITDKLIMEEYLKNPDESLIGPSAPRWINRNKLGFGKRPHDPLEIVSGDAEFKEIFRSSTKHEYIIDVKSPSKIKENTLFFPGWTLYVNNKPERIEYHNSEYPGIILFNLQKGLYKVELKFENTWVRTFSFYVSAAVAILMLVFAAIKLRKKNK